MLLLVCLNLLQLGQQVRYCWPIGRILAAVGQPDDAGRIHDEVATQLDGVSLDAVPPAASAHQLDVAPQCLQIPRPGEGALQAISMIDGPLPVKQHGERRTHLLLPDAGVPPGTEGYNQDLNIELLEFVSMVAQLCHVLAAGQSAQVAQEDQQHRTTAIGRQRDRLIVRRVQGEVGCRVAFAYHDITPRSLDKVTCRNLTHCLCLIGQHVNTGAKSITDNLSIPGGDGLLGHNRQRVDPGMTYWDRSPIAFLGDP